VELVLGEQATLIVGQNNSGKTSFSEVIRRFLVDQKPKFRIEDFSNASYDGFCEALKVKNAGKQDEDIRALIPSIGLRLLFRYDPDQPKLGSLSDFVIDLDPDWFSSNFSAIVCTTSSLPVFGLKILTMLPTANK
jgi:putative ATP-dependent endonuclease of the OLD family